MLPALYLLPETNRTTCQTVRLSHILSVCDITCRVPILMSLCSMNSLSSLLCCATFSLMESLYWNTVRSPIKIVLWNDAEGYAILSIEVYNSLVLSPVTKCTSQYIKSPYSKLRIDKFDLEQYPLYTNRAPCAVNNYRRTLIWAVTRLANMETYMWRIPVNSPYLSYSKLSLKLDNMINNPTNEP